MRIDGEQEDVLMEPLSSWLFKCTFTAPESNKKLLTDSILQKLQYSVFSVTIPKLAENNQDDISYGSFSLPFPYYSTGKKDLSIEFFETDDMLISRVFYTIQNKKRWKTKTIYRMADAELFLHVEIYPQRNVKGYAQPMKFPVFVRDYGLVMNTIDPPKFIRTGEVTLLKTKIDFNTVESSFYDEKDRSYQDSGINPSKEKYEWNKQAPETAFIDENQLGDRIASYLSKSDKKDPDNASSSDRFTTDHVSKNENLRKFAEGLGANSETRLAALAGGNSQKRISELRNLLEREGVNVKDYSDVADALYDMGIYGARSNHFCQRGVSVLEAIVVEQPRVLAPTASSSVPKWEAAGYEVTERKKVSSVQEINEYVANLGRQGKIKEGDKIIIDYDRAKQEPGHALTVLYNEERGLHVSSDSRHSSLSGLGMKHKVSEVTVLSMSKQAREDLELLEASKPGNIK